MAGVTPNEGEKAILEAFYKQVVTDRTALKIGLFKNPTGLDENSTLGDITPITGGTYTEQTLADIDWVITAGQVSHPVVDFVASGSAFDNVYGYYIYTTGASPRLIHFERNASAPVAIADTETYRVDLSIVAD